MEMDISEGHDPNCPACAKHQFDFLDHSSVLQASYTTLCGRDTVQINFRKKGNLDLRSLAERLKKSGRISGNEFLLRFTPDEQITITIFKDARVLVHGTSDIAKAKSIYSQYIGD